MAWGGRRENIGGLRRLVVLAMVMLVCVACGRKAPPVPPRFEGLTAPAGVVATAQGRVLTVAWADPPRSERRLVTGYRIYFSLLKKGEERCTGCPVRFETAGEAGPDERRFTLTVAPGVLYTVEVRAVAEGGYLSDPSRRAEVDLRELPDTEE